MMSRLERFLNQKVYSLEIPEWLREKNTERKKQEEAHNSQKDNGSFLLLFSIPEAFALGVRILFALTLTLSWLYASTLYLPISANPSRINPILASDSQSAEIAEWIFNGLFKYDKNGKIIVDLAESYRFLDATRLEVVLKKNVLWHDGEKLSADDVIFTLDTIRSPKLFSPYTSSYDVVEKIEKVDDYTIIIHYKKPYFRALEIWMSGILPKHVLENEQDIMTSKFNQSPIGTGPYTLKSLKSSSNIELNAFNGYFEGVPKIEKIVYRFMPDSTTSFLSLKNKELDVSGLKPIQYKKQLDDSFYENFNIYETAGYSYTYLGFNLQDKKFQDKKIREAISLLIDRKEIIDVMLFGYGKISRGPFLEGSIGYPQDAPSPEYNVQKAQAILESLGYNEKNRFGFEISVPSGGSGKYIAELIQYQLQKASIDVTIKSMEWQAFLNTVVEPRRFETVLMAWSTSLMPNPRSIWHSGSMKKGGFDFIGYQNEKVDKLIEDAETEVETEILSEKLQAIYKEVTKDIPYIFLYSPSSITAANKQIKNIDPALTGIMHNVIQWEKP